MRNGNNLISRRRTPVLRLIVTSGLIAITNIALGGALPLWPLTTAHAGKSFAGQTGQAAGSGTTLTYIPGSSVKLQQINGNCDWVA